MFSRFINLRKWFIILIDYRKCNKNGKLKTAFCIKKSWNMIDLHMKSPIKSINIKIRWNKHLKIYKVTIKSVLITFPEKMCIWVMKEMMSS